MFGKSLPLNFRPCSKKLGLEAKQWSIWQDSDKSCPSSSLTSIWISTITVVFIKRCLQLVAVHGKNIYTVTPNKLKHQSCTVLFKPNQLCWWHRCIYFRVYKWLRICILFPRFPPQNRLRFFAIRYIGWRRKVNFSRIFFCIRRKSWGVVVHDPTLVAKHVCWPWYNWLFFIMTAM